MTSLARTEMFKAIMACEKSKIKLFYSDTGKFLIYLQTVFSDLNRYYLIVDSLIVARPKNVSLPITLDNSIFGCYKKEILDTIETFYSLG